MRRPRALITLVLAIAAAGCAPGPTVALLTSTQGPGTLGCYPDTIEGSLVSDPVSGTAIIPNFEATPIMWPAGYTGRRSGPEIEVLDGAGRVVARTGTRVRLVGDLTERAPRAFQACTSVPVTLPDERGDQPTILVLWQRGTGSAAGGPPAGG